MKSLKLFGTIAKKVGEDAIFFQDKLVQSS
jgi:hypothetical protein